jgi:hypothetical protein
VRARHSTEELEDVSGQAGWMYTDLLLGLMVIFLATITFIPQNRAYLDSDVVQIYAREFPIKLATSYTSFDLDKIKADLKSFTDQKEITGNVIITRVQIVGSYDPRSESIQDGINRAMKFQRQIDTQDPLFLKSSAVTLKSAADTDLKKIVIEFSLSVEIQVLPETARR